MSSRLTRTLLKLYPRRIRNRYGDELLDLQDELRAQGDVSRMRLTWDMLAGAVLVRPARRAYLTITIGGVLLIGGLAVGDAAIGGIGAGSHPNASRSQAIAVVPPAPTAARRAAVATAVVAPPAPTATPAATASDPPAPTVVQPAPGESGGEGS